MYIKFNDPDLHRQKEIVFNLALFWCLTPPTWVDIIAIYISYKYKLKIHFSTVSRRLHLKSGLLKCIILYKITMYDIYNF